MAGMSRKEIARLLDHIEPQGVQLTRTTKGVMLRLPDKTSTMVHFSGSDHREADNVRARLKRSGVTWPTDGGDDLGPRITEHKPIRASLAKAEEALSRWEGSRINASQLVRFMGGDPQGNRVGEEAMTLLTAQRCLYHLGWTPTGKSTSRKWLRPLELEPEPIHLQTKAERAAVAAEAQAAAQAAAPEPIHLQPLAPQAPEPPQLALVPEDVQPPQLGPDSPAEPATAPARDSWAMAIDQLPNDTSVTSLWLMLAAMGLEGEIRVWRAGA